MRKLVLTLSQPIASEANNRLVHELLIKLVAKHGSYAQGYRWEYTAIFSCIFPYIGNQLMGWAAGPSRSPNKRLLLKLTRQGRGVIELWWRGPVLALE